MAPGSTPLTFDSLLAVAGLGGSLAEPHTESISFESEFDNGSQNSICAASDGQRSVSRESSIGPQPPFTQIPPTDNPQSLKRKASAEDLCKLAHNVGRRQKLSQESQGDLNDLAEVAENASQILQTAITLSVRDRLDAMPTSKDILPAAPPPPPPPLPTTFTIPTLMKEFIERQSFIVLMNPSLARYYDKDEPGKHISEKGPKEIIWNLVQTKENTDFHTSMKADPRKERKILAFIGLKLNDRRCSIKTKIKDSLPKTAPQAILAQDIGQLTRNVLNVLKSAQVQLKYQRCARIAFLRTAYHLAQAQHKDKDFWFVVESELARIRAEKSQEEQNKYFKEILTSDIYEFGMPDELKDIISQE